MILEAALGFSVLTVTLTYLQSVYSQLIQRNTFALSLHHRTARTADAAELLARMGASGDINSSARQDIANMAEKLLNILESHHSYPSLGYFRWQETYYAVARITFVLMDTVTLIKSAIDEQSYSAFVHSSAVAELGEGGMHFLAELSDSFLPPGYINRKHAEQIWRDRYYRAIERLQVEGIKTRLDKQEGADIYVCLRRKWNPYVVALAKYMEYEWSAIAPADGGYSI